MGDNVKQLKAAAQLAGMAYQADPQDHKLAAWEKAEREFDEAEAAEAEGLNTAAAHAETGAAAGGQSADQKDEQIKKLEGQLLLKDQTIEKLSGKLAIFESAKKSTALGKAPAKAAATTGKKAAATTKAVAPAEAPATAPAAPKATEPVATPAAPATAETATDEAKKNS